MKNNSEGIILWTLLGAGAFLLYSAIKGVTLSTLLSSLVTHTPATPYSYPNTSTNGVLAPGASPGLNTPFVTAPTVDVNGTGTGTLPVKALQA